MLLRYKRLTEEELQQIEAAAKKELSVANRKALAAPDPDPKSIFDYVCPILIYRKSIKRDFIKKKMVRSLYGNCYQRNVERGIPP